MNLNAHFRAWDFLSILLRLDVTTFKQIGSTFTAAADLTRYKP